MKLREKTLSRKILSGLLAASMVVAIVPGIAGKDTVYATGGKNKDNTCLGTSGISSPVIPGSRILPWAGSYVYFGKYAGDPIKFRVLAPKTSVYGGSTMFLDSDVILMREGFGNASSATNTWADSTIRTFLNGSFFTNSFTGIEKGAIATSVGNGGIKYKSGSYEEFMYGAPESVNDKIILLDAGEILNPHYGYSSYCGLDEGTDWATHSMLSYGTDVDNHIKYQKGLEGVFSDNEWWLRSSSSLYPSAAGSVWYGGFVFCFGLSDGYPRGTAPALNVDLSSIIFSTLISGSFNRSGAEFKLTVKDPNLKISVPSSKPICVSGQTVTVPYAISGITSDEATRVSILILDKEYKAGNTNNAKILYYDALGGSFSENGSGTFTLPSSLDLSKWGESYHVYILAEDINGEKETDYASAPFELVMPKSSITKAEPSDTGVLVKWIKAEGFTNYNVYRSDSLNGTYSYLASVTGGSLKYTDITAKGGKTYYYKVRPYTKAYGTTMYGVWSAAKKVTVLSDTKLTAEPKSGVTIRLSWTAVSGAQSYEIYRATNAAGPYTYVKSTTGTSTSDTGLVASTRYYYMVRAKKTVNGETQYSKYASAVTVALATPTLDSATFKSGKGVTLSWSKASGADRYNVYKYNTSTGKYDYVASVLGGTLTYTDASGKKGDYYKVRAYKKYDGVVYYGGWSNAKAGK